MEANRSFRSYEEFLRERLPKTREANLYSEQDPQKLGTLLGTLALLQIRRSASMELTTTTDDAARRLQVDEAS